MTENSPERREEHGPRTNIQGVLEHLQAERKTSGNAIADRITSISSSPRCAGVCLMGPFEQLR